MALSDDEKAVLDRLKRRLSADNRGGLGQLGFGVLDSYYDGVQELLQLGLAIPEDLRRFVTIVAWPAVVVDAVEERLDVEGFRLPGADDADEESWRVWQANGLDEETQMGHLDAFIYSRSYLIVGANEKRPDTPLVTVESPMDAVHSRDPRTGDIDAAAKIYVDPESLVRVGEKHATLYLPNATIWLTQAGRGWNEDGRDVHNLGEVPVTALVNRSRLKKRLGRSEMLRAIGLTDAAARALTNAQIATEVLAVPQRWVMGVTEKDFKDTDGKQMPAWEAYFGAIWALKNGEAKAGQFAAADLRNFETVINLYAQQVAGLYGLPMRYLGQNTANPPSADGIRADESRLVKRAERAQRAFGGAHERTARLCRRFQDGGRVDPKMEQLEVLWRDPATPTRAQAADATVKLVSQGILPLEAAWEDLGYSANRRQKLRAQMEAQEADPVMRALLKGQEATRPAAGGAEPAAEGQPAGAFLG